MGRVTQAMGETVHLLWFVQEMPEGEEDVELLVGVYASESEAKAAIERVKGKKGFADFQEGFQVHSYEVNRDHWTDGFIRD